MDFFFSNIDHWNHSNQAIKVESEERKDDYKEKRLRDLRIIKWYEREIGKHIKWWFGFLGAPKDFHELEAHKIGCIIRVKETGGRGVVYREEP